MIRPIQYPQCAGFQYPPREEHARILRLFQEDGGWKCRSAAQSAGIMVRLPAATAWLRTAEAYLAPQGSVAEDLAALGLRVEDPAAVDRGLAAFLAGGGGASTRFPCRRTGCWPIF